jgi:hypothetical protein
MPTTSKVQQQEQQQPARKKCNAFQRYRVRGYSFVASSLFGFLPFFLPFSLYQNSSGIACGGLLFWLLPWRAMVILTHRLWITFGTLDSVLQVLVL